MNQDDLFEAIGSVEDTVLHKSERKGFHYWKQLAAVAACFLILISGIIHFLPRKSGGVHKIYPGNVSWITDDPVERITNPQLTDSTAQIMYYQSWEYRFCWQISIEAQVKEVLPDIYVFPGGIRGQQYRILLLKVKDTIAGKNVPSEIYYLMPAALCPDLDQYDTLIMAIDQRQLVDCVMINASQKQIEAFQWMFYSGRYDPDWGGVLAFTDGKLDISLWELEGWGDRPDICKSCLSSNSYPGKENHTVKQVKKAIRDILQENRDKKWCVADELEVLSKEDVFSWREAQEALAYMEDKTFQQLRLGVDEYGGWYNRYINGLSSNESILVDRYYKKVKYSEARFTEEDLKNLPPLADMLGAAPTMQLPEGYENEDCRFSSAKGEYYKSGNEIFGILRVYWHHGKNKISRVILIRQDGTKIETTEEKVEDIIKELSQ